MSSRLWRTAAICAAVLQAPWARAQWSFELDTSFRTTLVDQNVNAVHVLPDGKLFLSGRIRFPGDMSVRGSGRLLPDGQQDLDFPTFPLTTGSGKTTPWLAGKFYVGTTTVRRMLPDGLIDPSFGPIGIGPYFQYSTTGDYHVFPDGRVLMSGSHLLSDSIRGFEGYYELIWFTNTGYLDTTRTHRNANGPIYDFKELPDGKFICSCSCSQYEGQPVSRLFRVHQDGALDTSFDPAINSGFFFDFHGLSDGRVYGAGRFKRTFAPDDTLFVARFMPNGALDPTFSPPQLSAVGLPNPLTGTLASVLFPWYDHLIFTGRFLSVNGEERSGIAMIDSAGALLQPFDGCGVAPWTYQGFTHVSIEDIESAGPDTLYICGAYVGFDDCVVHDTLQRFVSRLLVEDLGMAVSEPARTSWRVYPNPTSGNATVEMEEIPRDALLVLYDVLGREVLRQRVTNHHTTLQLQHLPDGCYNLEIRNGVRRLAHQRLVVQQ